jgi:hypothetical protein
LERVYTVTDHYDGPREGIATFCGRPYAYRCPFDFWKDEYADLYELHAIDDETLALALEDWAIWSRWRKAFDDGLTSIDTHPALPDDGARHAEIAPLLAECLAVRDVRALLVRGRFHPREGSADHLEVEWTLADS